MIGVHRPNAGLSFRLGLRLAAHNGTAPVAVRSRCSCDLKLYCRSRLHAGGRATVLTVLRALGVLIAVHATVLPVLQLLPLDAADKYFESHKAHAGRSGRHPSLRRLTSPYVGSPLPASAHPCRRGLA